MDVDQAARSNAQEYFGVKDPDYYEFEGMTRYDNLHALLRADRATHSFEAYIQYVALFMTIRDSFDEPFTTCIGNRIDIGPIKDTHQMVSSLNCVVISSWRLCI